MGGGAWPFLVGGVICLVNSDNERDSVLLTRSFVLGDHLAGVSAPVRPSFVQRILFLEGLAAVSRTR